MGKLLKKTSLFLLIVIVTSCGMLSGDRFVYLGHGKDTPDYQLYYDKTRKLFVLIDKRNGCFQKDDTGTCLALTLKQARQFREEVLAKMIEIDLRLAKDSYGNYAIKELQRAGITTVNKPIKTKDVYATPVRQIVLDRKQQYHLVRDTFKIEANLVAMVVTDDSGEKRIKVVYTVDFPGLQKKYGADLRPFVIDPEYLYTHMTIDTVHESQYMQRHVMKNQANVRKEVNDYLKNVVDDQEEITGENQEQDIANKVSALDSDLVTKADIRADEEAMDGDASSSPNNSGSSIETNIKAPATGIESAALKSGSTIQKK